MQSVFGDANAQEKSDKWNSLLCNLIVFHTAIDMTATRRQRQHSWTVVAGMRRAVGALRYVNDELTRVSEAIFRPAGAPLPHTPAAPLPWPAARRQRPPDTPAAPPDLARRTLTAVMTVPATPVAGTVMRRRGRARRGHRGRSVRTEKNIWP